MQTLPASPSLFSEKKTKILSQLSVPDADYTDASPKGSVDEGIRDLIDEINDVDGFVTTSSCAGRVSVFLEGKKTAGPGQDGQVAGVGGKGAGGTWLYISHESVDEHSDEWERWTDALELGEQVMQQDGSRESPERRLIHFRFEPMILHVLTASLVHAQLVLRCALQSGFRESGALNLVESDADAVNPMVGIRSMGLGFASLIGWEADGRRGLFVPQYHLRTLMSIANERFAENAKRIHRFRCAFREAVTDPAPKKNPEGLAWEDKAARKERLKAEGLKKRDETRAAKARHQDVTDGERSYVELGELPLGQ